MGKIRSQKAELLPVAPLQGMSRVPPAGECCLQGAGCSGHWTVCDCSSL